MLAALALLAQLPVLAGWFSAAVDRQTDTSLVVAPALADARAVLGRGEWPWWNPYAHLGEPFAVSGAQPLYPGYWPVLFGGLGWLPWVLALHSVLACGFAYRWLRALPGSRFVAFVGGGLYGIGCAFQAELLTLPEAAAMAWLPLALEATWRLTRPGQRDYAVVLLAVGAAAVIATGARVTPSFGLATCALLGLLNLRGLPGWDRLPALGRLALGTVGAALLSAPVWLQNLELAAAVTPGRAQPANAASHLATLFAPLQLDGAAGRLQAEGVLFPGTLVLAGLLLGCLRPSRGRPRWPWFLVAALGVLGTTDGPWRQWLPAAFALSDGGGGLVLLHLALIALTCLALDGFFELPAPHLRTQLAGSACLTLGSAITAVAIEPGLWPWLCQQFSAQSITRGALPSGIGLILLGAALLTWRRLGILRFKTTIASLALLECLALAWWSAPQRTEAVPVTIHGAELGRVIATDGVSLRSLARADAPVQRVNSVATPRLTRVAAFLSALASDLPYGDRHDTARTALSSALMALARIEVVLGDGASLAASPPGAEPVEREPLDWARMVFEVLPVADANAARAALSTINPSKTVVLEGHADAFPTRAPHRSPIVSVVDRSAHHAHIRVDAGQGRGYLVIADSLAPGWRATVDGEPAALVAANLAFRAIAVNEGKHDVELTYAPTARWLGLPLCGLGAALAIAASLFSWSKVRQRRSARPAKKA